MKHTRDAPRRLGGVPRVPPALDDALPPVRPAPPGPGESRHARLALSIVVVCGTIALLGGSSLRAIALPDARPDAFIAGGLLTLTGGGSLPAGRSVDRDASPLDPALGKGGTTAPVRRRA
jgi:hypothetical protein